MSGRKGKWAASGLHDRCIFLLFGLLSIVSLNLKHNVIHHSTSSRKVTSPQYLNSGPHWEPRVQLPDHDWGAVDILLQTTTYALSWSACFFSFHPQGSVPSQSSWLSEQTSQPFNLLPAEMTHQSA